MLEGEILTRKRRVRGGHKASVSRTLTLVEEALQTLEANASKLKQYLRLLRDKLSIIETLMIQKSLTSWQEKRRLRRKSDRQTFS